MIYLLQVSRRVVSKWNILIVNTMLCLARMLTCFKIFVPSFLYGLDNMKELMLGWCTTQAPIGATICFSLCCVMVFILIVKVDCNWWSAMYAATIFNWIMKAKMWYRVNFRKHLLIDCILQEEERKLLGTYFVSRPAHRAVDLIIFFNNIIVLALFFQEYNNFSY